MQWEMGECNKSTEQDDVYCGYEQMAAVNEFKEPEDGVLTCRRMTGSQS
jgi:hypothetical protein